MAKKNESSMVLMAVAESFSPSLRDGGEPSFYTDSELCGLVGGMEVCWDKMAQDDRVSFLEVVLPHIDWQNTGSDNLMGRTITDFLHVITN